MRLSEQQKDIEMRLCAVHQIIYDIQHNKEAMKKLRAWMKKGKIK